MTRTRKSPATQINGAISKGHTDYNRASVENLLSRLDKVRDRGHGQYLACCPAHDDKSPSLSIKECADGTLLIHCFGGCDSGDVLAAIGLEVGDLFPRDPHYHERPKSRYERRVGPRDALAAVAYEVTVATVIIGDVRYNRSINDEDWQRLLTAARRIRNAQEVAHGCA